MSLQREFFSMELLVILVVPLLHVLCLIKVVFMKVKFFRNDASYLKLERQGRHKGPFSVIGKLSDSSGLL